MPKFECRQIDQKIEYSLHELSATEEDLPINLNLFRQFMIMPYL